jgi:hypothetical protein
LLDRHEDSARYDAIIVAAMIDHIDHIVQSSLHGRAWNLLIVIPRLHDLGRVRFDNVCELIPHQMQSGAGKIYAAFLLGTRRARL